MYYAADGQRTWRSGSRRTHTVSGRNVGQATTLTAGLLYTFHF